MFPTINKKETGVNLRRIMDMRGVKPKDIQEYLGFGCVQSVYRWLDGVSMPTVDNLYAISKMLQVPILFNELVLSDKLFEHRAEIDEAARNRMELIVRSLAEQNGVTEQLKAENQMEWVRQMNACKAQTEEIVKAELIYD
jgi:transcriptional regulator with XRE-family HTH domain